MKIYVERFKDGNGSDVWQVDDETVVLCVAFRIPCAALMF